jgi:hypothetical protein
MTKKIIRNLRRSYFFLLRVLNIVKNKTRLILTKTIVTIFPKSKKAFEEKDELQGLEHGPSSYFLKKISEKEDTNKVTPKTRRKIKNV